MRVINLLDDNNDDGEIVIYRSGGRLVFSINIDSHCAVRIVVPCDGDPAGMVTAEVAKCLPKNQSIELNRKGDRDE